MPAHPSQKVYACSNVNVDYFKYLNECLAMEGLDVTPVFLLTETEYRSASKRKGLTKAVLRVKMYIAYPLRLLARCLIANRDSVFVVTSNTFYAPTLAALVGKLKGFKTIHLVYDLYPDAMEVSGAAKINGLLSAVIGFVMKTTQRLCCGAVFLGDFLREHAEGRWGKAGSSARIDIGADTRNFARHKPVAGSGPLVFHYGGQLGYMHDADALILSVKEALASLAPSNPAEFNFMVSGAQATKLKTELGGPGVAIADAVPSDAWREAIKKFQVGLVTLSPGGSSVCLPSKTYAMMGGGLAILAICPIWSDLADLVLSNEAGWVVNNSPYSSKAELQGPDYLQKIRERRPDADIARDFRDRVLQIQADPAELLRRRGNAFTSTARFYGPESSAKRWGSFLRGLGDGSTSKKP